MNKQLVGNTGLFYVSYQLSLRNWNVLITSRNMMGADLFAISENGKKCYGIQVKTNLNEMDVKLTKNFNHESLNYWIIIYNMKTNPECYIIPSKDIKDSYNNLIHDSSLNGKILVTADRKNSETGNQNFWIYKKYLIKDREKKLYYENWKALD